MTARSVEYPERVPNARKAVFLDRDGVINRKLPEGRYVTSVSEFEFLPGVSEALSILSRLGFLLVVVTNQRGIARGYMTDADLNRIHEFMERDLAQHGVVLSGIYCCPHEEFEGCSCRKPQPGLILDAIRDLKIDPGCSYMVGDSPSDIAAGRGAGTRTVRIGKEDDSAADMVFPSLFDFAVFLQEHAESR